MLFWYLRNYPTLRSTVFLVYFIFWRGAYDFGFAWVLRQQSERRWVVRLLREWGWLQGSGNSLGQKEKENTEGKEWAKWWKKELEMKMGEGYKWEDVPAEFNSWLMFRQLVDIVLLK
jgi:phosphatidylethanolamine N-methyltransferase